MPSSKVLLFVLIFLVIGAVYVSTGKYVESNYVVVSNYDYVVFGEGRYIYAVDASGVIYKSTSADEVLNYVIGLMKNYESLYVKPGIYWIGKPIVIKNKMGVKIYIDGEIKPVIKFPRNEYLIKIVGVSWKENRDNDIYVEHIDCRGFTNGLLLQDGFRNYITVRRLDYPIVGIELRNYNSWSEANVIRDSQIYGVYKYGILFRRMNKGAKSFKATVVSNVMFGLLKPHTVGIYIDKVSLYESSFMHLDGWSDSHDQVLIYINGYVDKSVFEVIAMESGKLCRVRTYVVKIGKYMFGVPTFINVRSGDLTASIYNPYRKRIFVLNG